MFLRAGLVEYGSIFGHGAYLGPDFTADYLHRAAELALGTYGGSDQARQRGTPGIIWMVTDTNQL